MFRTNTKWEFEGTTLYLNIRTVWIGYQCTNGSYIVGRVGIERFLTRGALPPLPVAWIDRTVKAWFNGTRSAVAWLYRTVEAWTEGTPLYLRAWLLVLHRASGTRVNWNLWRVGGLLTKRFLRWLARFAGFFFTCGTAAAAAATVNRWVGFSASLVPAALNLAWMFARYPVGSL